MSPLTRRVAAWRDEGETREAGGRTIFRRLVDGPDPAIVLLHGFPSSSYDFRALLPRLGGHAVLTFDFLGFGLSAKPAGRPYSLFTQANIAEEVVAQELGGRQVVLVAHDMGTSVATELLARDLDGTGRLSLRAALLFNGSIVLERASLTPAQKLLRSRLGPLAARLSNRWAFRREFAALFTRAHPLTDAEAADQWSLICHNGGRAIGHELIAYLDERVEFAARWHGAVRDWPGPLSLAWGLEDPVATVSVLDALRELRPGVPVQELAGLGHYPQIEDPARVVEAIETAAALSKS